MDNNEIIQNGGELFHYGRKGMKWYQQIFTKDKKSGTSSTKKRELSPEEKAELKKDIIKKGDVKSAYANRMDFDDNEIQQVISRFNSLQRLKDISSADVKTGLDKFSSIMDKIGKIGNGISKGVSTYNTFAKINNSLSSNKLPILDGAEEKAKQIDAAHEKIVKSGTIKEIRSNLGSFTAKEVEDMSKRLKFEDDINKRYEKEESARKKAEQEETAKKEADKQAKAAQKEAERQKKASKEDDPLRDALYKNGVSKEEADEFLKKMADRVNEYANSQSAYEESGREYVKNYTLTKRKKK